MKKRILIFFLCFVVVVAAVIVPISAATDTTLFNIYDNQDNNRVVGYYTLTQLGQTSVYDVNLVVITYDPCLYRLIQTYNDALLGFQDDDIAESYLLAEINNSFTYEENPYMTSSANIGNNWIFSLVTGLFNSPLSSDMTTLLGYQNSLNLKYSEGYNDGVASVGPVTEDAVDEAYYNGYEEGYLIGKRDGIDSVDTLTVYQEGLTDGVTESQGATKFIWSYFTAPFIFLSNLFNFKIFGIDFYQLVLSLLTAVLVIFVFRFILSKVG